MNAPGFYGWGCPCDMCQPRKTEALKEMAESMAEGYFGRREHDAPCEIERVEPGWNVQSDSGEVFVGDAEIAELRDKLDGGDIQAARLIAERYSAAYADGFAAGVELGESRAAAAAAPVASKVPSLDAAQVVAMLADGPKTRRDVGRAYRSATTADLDNARDHLLELGLIVVEVPRKPGVPSEVWSLSSWGRNGEP